MLTVAFLANQFPSAIETYVVDQFEELQRRRVRVVTGSALRVMKGISGHDPDIILQPVPLAVIARAGWLCLSRWRNISPLIRRIVFRGRESPLQRLKALGHTFLGACYAAMLEKHGVEHIHVHHGYFGSWIAMAAAQLLKVPFSIAFYGSDLLLHRAYLDIKLEQCAFCLTISEFNRQYILKQFPKVEAGKLSVVRLGVDAIERAETQIERRKNDPLKLLSVGRLHPVKDHAFLVRACSELLARKVDFQCFLVGEGSERPKLESLIRKSALSAHIHLLGYVSQERRDALYDEADIVVLTSRSEGIPVTIMEAMGRGRVVLAPAITGIPELVLEGKTGFLYKPGVMDDLVAHIVLIWSLIQAERDSTQPQHPTRLERIRGAAQLHIAKNFNRQKNVELFGDVFLQRVIRTEGSPDENLILQQI